jgi:hypothetical protein
MVTEDTPAPITLVQKSKQAKKNAKEKQRRKNKETLAKESAVVEHEAEAEAGADRPDKAKVRGGSLPR